MTVAAAWYPDPVHPSRLRWWDGRAWTDFVSDAPPAVREHSPRTTHSAGFVVRADAVRQAQGIRLTGGTIREADAPPRDAPDPSRHETAGEKTGAPLTRRALRGRRGVGAGAALSGARAEAAARAEAEALAVAQAEAITAAEKQFHREASEVPPNPWAGPTRGVGRERTAGRASAPSAAPRDWVPSSPLPGIDGPGRPVASASPFQWVSTPNQRDATNGWTWLIALSPVWFTVAFAAPDWIDAAVGAGTMTESTRVVLSVLTWAVLIAAVVFDWSRLRRASFPQPVSWVLGVLLLPMYMILRAVRVHATVRRGMAVMWIYLVLQFAAITWALLPVMSFAPAVPMLDGPGMEQHLEDSYATDHGIAVTATCPADVSLDAGREFSCEVVLPDGRVEVILATVTDADGTVSWIPASEMLPDNTA
ncbi:hypothetical protein L1277_001071 [Okibacterium sp. HSC-33S16]|uniref:DUF2510 domain-containing protein n=1 Tax=Okibacterium sp. HSC-33S16 TaxID=2910965 RepID=UPI0020A053FB|nr:DUF2510 domain-containing protein [Okibacterium sp. HSC-33S16]MCP2030980.1 hypothetical protein [Okibacterium sp. HSC-33S16]